MSSPRHRFKKRFGQNFLQDRQVIDKIITAARLDGGERVIEIGPGRGALTEELLRRAAEVTVCEVDPELIEYWQGRNLDRLEVLSGDVLEHDWETVFPEAPYKLVANLPYNISSPVLFKIIDHRELFSRLVLMFQREVGERIVASPGNKDYGILSVLGQVWYDISKVTLVRAGAFYPPPKVDSIVLVFKPLEKPLLCSADWPHFKRVVKGSFAQRRKSLRNTLSSVWDRDQVETALRSAAIDSARRAETLGIEEFLRLAEALKERVEGQNE